MSPSELMLMTPCRAVPVGAAAVLQTVSIAASDATAREPTPQGTDTGTFTIQRSDSQGKLAIDFLLSGTARLGTDYILRRQGTTKPLTTRRITLAAGEASAVIEVVPKTDAATESDESVVLKLKSSRAYQLDPLSENQQATASIADNAPPTVTVVQPLAGTQNTPLTISYSELLAASDAVDPEGSTLFFRIGVVKKGSLLKDGKPVVRNSTTLGPGETWVWNPPNGVKGQFGAFTVTATDGSNVSARAVTVAVKLADLYHLTDATNIVVAGEGLNSLQFAPDGTLARLLWTGSGLPDDESLTLKYSERKPDGTWSEEELPGGSIGPVQGMEWQPPDPTGAQLLFTSDGVPHVLLFDGEYFWHFFRTSGTWRSEHAELNLSGPTVDAEVLVAAVGADDSLHVAFSDDWTDGGPSIVYGNNVGGSWTFQTAFHTPGSFSDYYHQTGTYPRFFGLAVDSQDMAHVVYTPEFVNQGVVGGTHVLSLLGYATNRSGTWTTETICSPANNSGDAGLGASIAIDPATDRPAIASFVVDRVGTGSPIHGKLVYHTQQADGAWTHQTVASSADGYSAGDGNKGTGFAPKLLFDDAGRANILFCDYASQHFAGFGADEFAGQLRHARLNGNHWNIKTVFRQTDPVHNYLINPTMAIFGDRVAYMATWKQDKLGSGGRVVSSNYRLLDFTLPLIT